jgi:putative NIF3 family GTP cyclohydrolase 1 type 2
MRPVSRREFARTAAAAVVPLALPRSLSARAALTAQDVIERIQQKVGVPWRADTVDTIKAGNAATAVTGIATTSMATLDALQRAVQAHANFVITLEPTFYSHADRDTPAPARGQTTPPDDRVFAAKRDFITQHQLVVWRFSDHWRARRPDPLLQGFADALGWSGYKAPGDSPIFEIPATTLASLAGELKRQLNTRGGIRVVGRQDTRIRTVALLPGSTPITASVSLLPQVDAIVAGEVREWESVTYAQDVVFSGKPKGLALVGRIVSEAPAMKACADWLKTVVPDVPTTWLPSKDPYWRPR